MTTTPEHSTTWVKVGSIMCLLFFMSIFVYQAKITLEICVKKDALQYFYENDKMWFTNSIVLIANMLAIVVSMMLTCSDIKDKNESMSLRWVCGKFSVVLMMIVLVQLTCFIILTAVFTDTHSIVCQGTTSVPSDQKMPYSEFKKKTFLSPIVFKVIVSLLLALTFVSILYGFLSIVALWETVVIHNMKTTGWRKKSQSVTTTGQGIFLPIASTFSMKKSNSSR